MQFVSARALPGKAVAFGQPQPGQPNMCTFKIAGGCDFAVSAPLQAVQTFAAYPDCWGMLCGEMSVWNQWDGSARHGRAGSLLLGLGWCFTPGSCDLCSALPAYPTLLVVQVCAQVSSSFMQAWMCQGKGQV